MKYELVYTKRAIKDIKRLESSIKKRIKENLKIFTYSPLKYCEKLTNPVIGSYRFRIGDYRVIFDIDEYKIIILRIGHRREVYRKL